jgi:8-oxo-dGTP diphosphatase
VSVTAGAFLVRPGAVLLGRRAPHKSFAGMWDVIGGHVEPGETPWAALVRELNEEIGVVAAAGVPLATLAPGTATPAVLHLYAIHAWTGTPTLRNDEHVALRWFTPAAAMRLPDLATALYRPLLAMLAER